MTRLNLILFLTVAICLAVAHGARVARSPQFGGFSQANAQAQAGGGGFGGGFGGPRPPFGGPGFGPRPPIFGSGYRRPASGGSISISKSITISRGGGGGAQSSASSSSSGK